MTVETLIVTVDRQDHFFAEQMNIQTKVLIGNQCSKDAVERFCINGNDAVCYCTSDRGVGINRNLLLDEAEADICVLADDDLRFADGYPETAVRAFRECPDADVIVFNLIEKVPRRYVNTRIRRIKGHNYSRYGAARIALRRETINAAGIRFSPYFGEYRAYVSNFDGKLVEVQTDPVTFEPDPKALAAAVTPKTKAVILNSPNNPTGVVYSEECIREIARLLEDKQKEYGTTIFIFSDEPYREIVYGEYKVPWIPNYYRNTVVGYSYSKSLSLPGERIGYLVLPSEIDDAGDMISAANVANRILGFVNAPSLQQRVVAKCLNEKTDVDFYAENRQMLMDGLREAGYTFVEPQGAFYLWLKSPEEDEKAFVAKCKEKQILIVPGSSFGCAGWTRVAYCVSHETVRNSLPGFREVAASYGL